MLCFMPVPDEKTALMLAAQGGHTETVQELIEAGADVGRKCQVTFINMIYIDIYKLYTYSGSPYALVLYVNSFLHFQQKDRKTALMMAAEGGHAETVGLLVKAGADVSIHIEQKIYNHAQLRFCLCFTYLMMYHCDST